MFRRVATPAQYAGRLYLHTMPGRFERWEHFLSKAASVNLDLLVCLTPDEEVRRKSPAYFAARSSGSVPFAIEDFPIEDFGVPPEAERDSFRQMVERVARELEAGKNVLIHCGMGIGRTGTVATCVLLALGLDAASSIRLVEEAGSGAEISEQKKLIAWFASDGRPPDRLIPRAPPT